MYKRIYHLPTKQVFEFTVFNNKPMIDILVHETKSFREMITEFSKDGYNIDQLLNHISTYPNTIIIKD